VVQPPGEKKQLAGQRLLAEPHPMEFGLAKFNIFSPKFHENHKDSSTIRRLQLE